MKHLPAGMAMQPTIPRRLERRARLRFHYNNASIVYILGFKNRFNEIASVF